MSPRARLRAFVEQSGVPVKALADAMGVSRATLYLLMATDEELAARGEVPQIASRRVAESIEAVAGIPRTEWSPLYADITDNAA